MDSAYFISFQDFLRFKKRSHFDTRGMFEVIGGVCLAFFLLLLVVVWLDSGSRGNCEDKITVVLTQSSSCCLQNVSNLFQRFIGGQSIRDFTLAYKTTKCFLSYFSL